MQVATRVAMRVTIRATIRIHEGLRLDTALDR